MQTVANHEVFKRPDGTVMQVVKRLRDGRTMAFGPGKHEDVHKEAVKWGRS